MASKTVLRIFKELIELHEAKDSDYGGSDSLSNFRTSEQFGVPAWKGASIRMADKWSRFLSLAKKPNPAVTSESIEDTLRDIAVYAVIVLALREEATKPKAEQPDPEWPTAWADDVGKELRESVNRIDEQCQR